MRPAGDSLPALFPAAERQQWRLLMALLPLLAIAVLAAHWPALTAQTLTFDDDQYLLNNFLVRTPSWFSARQFLAEVLRPTTVGGYYQPLAMISLMLDYAAAGSTDNLRPFHATSLSLHVANTLLIATLLFLIFRRVWPAIVPALLFGLHPLTVEPIPWIGERKTLLAAFFALISLVFYVQYTKLQPGETEAGPAGRRWTCYGASLLAFMLALMSKPTSTLLPVMLLMMDYWPLRRFNRSDSPNRGRRGRYLWLLVEKAPFLLLSVFSGIITYISQERSCGMVPPEYPASHVPLIITHNIVFYLHKIVWPVNLSLFYPFPAPFALTNPVVLWGVVGTVVLLCILLISWRWTPALLTGWLMFFLMQLPTMQIVRFSDVIAADKFAYLPAVGLLITLGWVVNGWCRVDAAIPGRVRNRAALGGAIVLLLAFAEVRRTRDQLGVWQDTPRLYTHMLALAPDSGTLHQGMGVDLARKGRLDKAIPHLERAVKALSHRSRAHINLGFALLEVGRPDEALTYFKRAAELTPLDPEAYNLLGLAFAKKRDFAQAETHFTKAVELGPFCEHCRLNFGQVLLDMNRPAEAREQYWAVIQINPRETTAWLKLSEACRRQGDLEKAVVAAKSAVQLLPSEPDPHMVLAEAYEAQGRLEAAISEYRRVLRLDPDSATAEERLRAISSSLGIPEVP